MDTRTRIGCSASGGRLVGALAVCASRAQELKYDLSIRNTGLETLSIHGPVFVQLYPTCVLPHPRRPS